MSTARSESQSPMAEGRGPMGAVVVVESATGQIVGHQTYGSEDEAAVFETSWARVGFSTYRILYDHRPRPPQATPAASS